MRKKAIAIPDTDVCGACTFCRVSPQAKDDYLCMAMPPVVLGSPDDYIAVRGSYVELEDPKCSLYKPRINS